jgi:CTP:molybdopterin cytidylyltransferase MocA
VRVAAILLAAGEGRRMGLPKALLPLSGGTFLSHLGRLFAASGCAPVVAVIGAEADRVAREAGLPAGVVLAVNERWREGMLGSLWCGLDAVEARGGADAVLVHPVDNPLVSADTVAAVIGSLRAGSRIAVPSHRGRRGHPAGFASSLWPALRGAPVAQGARSVLAAHPDLVVHVPSAEDCLVDLDTPQDLARIGEG